MTLSTPSLGPSIWTVSDGRAGNAAQVNAIAKALGETRRWMQIAHIHGYAHRASPLTLTPRAPWTWLPGINWPAPLLALPREQRASLTPTPSTIHPSAAASTVASPLWPTVWIAAGRRSAPYTGAVRRWSAGETLTIQMLDPKGDPSAFDLVIVPEHDRLTGPNVIRTFGSPTHFSEEAIEAAGQAFADLADERAKSAIVILGGDSKTHRFTAAAASKIAEQLKALSAQGWRLRITTSRRTPLNITVQMRALADQIGARFWAGAEDGPNPYLGWLLFSNAAIVTEDSANMLCDAAWHGLPVHIARLSGQSAKFERLHESLIERGCARWFDGSLEHWTYAPLREAGRVADLIIAELIKRRPQPKFQAIETGKTAPPAWL